ncbi:cysteine-rich receptor-like protein kinase [Trifolium pratense]|uniref:Cysteine-rich receptor-like protein kinase n=1 Tax=Trifolium pratense TaxID=57577 RepID=A0A2K3MWQ4_TRIPR|nr:cysteine-rich receptor-like protein kinase [Trifolium pratense]
MFEIISGLKVNFHKSGLIRINVEDSWLKDAASVLNCKVGSLPFSYLGIPIGADPRKIRTWEPAQLFAGRSTCSIKIRLDCPTDLLLIVLQSTIRRLFDISLVKEAKVAEMLVEEEGVKKINWRWRRNLFEWEKEMVEVCSSLVFSVKRADGEGDVWKWREESYSVKEAYQVIKEGEEVGETECEWRMHDLFVTIEISFGSLRLLFLTCCCGDLRCPAVTAAVFLARSRCCFQTAANNY